MPKAPATLVRDGYLHADGTVGTEALPIDPGEALGARAWRVLPADELEARLAAHEQRVATDLAALPPVQAERKGRGKHKGGGLPTRCERIAARRGGLPNGRKWESLVVVPCGGCRKLLLAPRDEWVRVAAVSTVRTHIPPPVCGRDRAGKPLCARCDAGGEA